MPQPKSPSRRSSGGRRSSGARQGGTAKRSAGARKTAGGAKRGTAKRSAAKRTTAKGTTAKRSSPKRGGATAARGAGGAEDARANLKAFRDALASTVSSLNLVLVSRDRIQEVLDDAVTRGRVTRDDANEMVATLVRRGVRQTEDLMKDFEQLLGRSREQVEDAATDARKRAAGAGTRARRAPTVDRVLREVDRGRRAAGIPPTFPILAYDDLSAAQVGGRLDDLTPAELRKVRDYERRHANRKSVLSAIEKALA